MKSLIVDKNTLTKDIIINGITIQAGQTGEFFNIDCPICNKKKK